MVYPAEYCPVELINIGQGNYYKGEGITMYNSSGKKEYLYWSIDVIYIGLYVIWWEDLAVSAGQ